MFANERTWTKLTFFLGTGEPNFLREILRFFRADLSLKNACFLHIFLTDPYRGLRFRSLYFWRDRSAKTGSGVVRKNSKCEKKRIKKWVEKWSKKMGSKKWNPVFCSPCARPSTHFLKRLFPRFRVSSWSGFRNRVRRLRGRGNLVALGWGQLGRSRVGGNLVVLAPARSSTMPQLDDRPTGDNSNTLRKAFTSRAHTARIRPQ